MKTIELKVTGMKCVNCEKHVADAMKQAIEANPDHDYQMVEVVA